MRRVFIGDIQGCCAELIALLDKVGFDQGRDVLYPVGDMVRKGPDNDGVLDLLIKADAQPVLGNHDLRFLERGEARDAGHERWLRAQPYVRLMSDLIVVHAGLHPLWTERDLLSLHRPEDIRFAVTVRYCDATGVQPPEDWPPPSFPYLPWYEFYRGERTVVFGHWARQGLVRTDKVIGLDTGCVYGKTLTAWIPEEDRLVCVPSRQSPVGFDSSRDR
jgi:bis(5'-nucleosyl)-tetraphosphatase (symmetrical)